MTHEAAALRFTNLATSHLDMTLHFLRVGGDGALLKGYENDGLAAADRRHGLDRGPVGVQEVERAHRLRATPTARPRTTSTPTRRPARSGAPRRPGARMPRSSRSPSACRSRRPSGSAGARRRVRASSTLPRRVVLPPRARRARRALGRTGVAERAPARPRAVAAAVGHLPGRRRRRGVRVPRGARRPVADARAMWRTARASMPRSHRCLSCISVCHTVSCDT